MNSWELTRLRYPDEGKKVLCCDYGNFYTSFRFGNYFIPLNVTDRSTFKTMTNPNMWQHIDFPDYYTGNILIFIDYENSKETIKIKKLKDYFPEIYEDFLVSIKTFVESTDLNSDAFVKAEWKVKKFRSLILEKL